MTTAAPSGTQLQAVHPGRFLLVVSGAVLMLAAAVTLARLR